MVESRQAMSEPTSSTPSRPPAAVPLSTRLRVALELLLGLRPADLQTARIYADAQFAGQSLAVRWAKLVRWAWHQMWVSIPGVSGDLIIRGKISRTPMWLIDANPLANHPWESDPSTRLPQEVDTVVIGAGFTGAALAYHWARRAPEDRRLLVLEMDDPASGSSGRNEGLVVMGRYFKMVHDTVLDRLPSLRPDLNRDQRRRLARQFAGVYCQAAYRNADMIEKTILSEGFDCDYSRSGWVQGQDALGQAGLEASVKMAVETGFTDWTHIGPEEVAERSRDAGESCGGVFAGRRFLAPGQVGLVPAGSRTQQAERDAADPNARDGGGGRGRAVPGIHPTRLPVDPPPGLCHRGLHPQDLSVPA